MVSPPFKRGALIADGHSDHVTEAASGGGAITYITEQPTEPGVEGYADGENAGVQVLSTRTADGWRSKDISAPHATPPEAGSGVGQEYRFFSEDLAVGLIHPKGALTRCENEQGQPQPCLSPLATEATTFLREDFLGGNPQEPCTSNCYQPLVTAANDTAKPFAPFGEQGCEPNTPGSTYCGPEFEAASPDGRHVILASNVALTDVALTATALVARPTGLYEWTGGRLADVSVLPEDEDNGQVVDGEIGFQGVDARGAVSDDGSRVFWEHEGHLYLRYNVMAPQSPLGPHGECEDPADACTIRLDVPQPGASGAGEARPKFQLATSDGSKVFFTDTQKLTENSGAIPAPTEPDLYECEIVEEAAGQACHLSDLTPVAEHKPADVLNVVIGASTDGSWVYFVANGVLQNNGIPVPGAVHGNCSDKGEPEPHPEALCNLYVSHDGHTSLVSVLSGEDILDWGRNEPGVLSDLVARVSDDGRWLSFMSQRELTGYDNHDAVSGRPDEEAFLYDADSGRVVCVSCQPSGARPVGIEFGHRSGINMRLVAGEQEWFASSWLSADLPGWSPYRGGGLTARFQPRYLSNGGRMFFNSYGPLVPQDGNGTWDVYEYEPAGYTNEAGTLECSPSSSTYSERSNGCVSLVSSGTAATETAFVNASENGSEAFFLTTAQLSPQDKDSSPDIYDAHECTTKSPCLPATAETPPACTTADACRAAPTPQPEVFGAPASATFSGPGNTSPTPPAKPKPPTSTEVRAKHLSTALKQCRKDEKKARRESCERRARRKYGAVKKRARA